MNIWERVRCTLNVFHTVSWMSKRGTWSQYVKTSFRPLRKVRIFSSPALLETRRQVLGFNTILKQNIRAWSGEQNHPRGKKFSKMEDQNNVELVFINSVWYTRNLCLKKRQWILNFTDRCWRGKWSQFQEWGCSFEFFPLAWHCLCWVYHSGFLANHSVVINHPLCSPDLASAYIFLFPTMKTTLHRRSRTSWRL